MVKTSPTHGMDALRTSKSCLSSRSIPNHTGIPTVRQSEKLLVDIVAEESVRQLIGENGIKTVFYKVFEELPRRSDMPAGGPGWKRSEPGCLFVDSCDCPDALS